MPFPGTKTTIEKTHHKLEIPGNTLGVTSSQSFGDKKEHFESSVGVHASGSTLSAFLGVTNNQFGVKLSAPGQHELEHRVDSHNGSFTYRTSAPLPVPAGLERSCPPLAANETATVEFNVSGPPTAPAPSAILVCRPNEVRTCLADCSCCVWML